MPATKPPMSKEMLHPPLIREVPIQVLLQLSMILQVLSIYLIPKKLLLYNLKKLA